MGIFWNSLPMEIVQFHFHSSFPFIFIGIPVEPHIWNPVQLKDFQFRYRFSYEVKIINDWWLKIDDWWLKSNIISKLKTF